jgi:acyl carrier protein
MGSQQLYDALKEVLIGRLKVEPEVIKPEADLFEDLGLDSIDLMTAVMAIEEQFGIEVPDSDLEGVNTVEQAIAVLQSKVQVNA